MVGRAAGAAVRAPHTAAPCLLQKVRHSLSLGKRRLPAGSSADCSWAHCRKVSDPSTNETCFDPMRRI